LQKANALIDKLLQKKVVTLENVQKVKEMMDDHFNLYKVTGDVGEGIAKEGLVNIRKDLKNFIEKQVKKNTGTDIGELNNNVATSRSIVNAITDRSTRGLTRANVNLSDLGWFGTASIGGGPLTGIAAVFVKRVLENPTVQLRIAKYIKDMSLKQQEKIKASLKAGDIPSELEIFIKKK
jgi:hypothetical protein